MLFNIIQPHAKHHQLHSFDINLLLHFISSQTQTADNELWFPICLPTLSQSGFVNAYQCCLGMDNLKLTIISQDPTLEEFERLRSITENIRLEFGLGQNEKSLLRIYQLKIVKEVEDVITDEQFIWERTKLLDHFNNRNETFELHTVKQKFGHHLIRSIKKASNNAFQEHLMQSYCEIASITHFVFRYSAPIRNCSSGSIAGGGYLSQCYSPSMNLQIKDSTIKRRVRKAYERMCLHLRLGSTTSQSKIDAFDDSYGSDVNEFRSSQMMHERRLQDHDRLIYFKHENELFLGLIGQNYELYAYFNTNIAPFDAHVLSGALVDTLLHDIHDLLHCKPQSF